MCLLTIVAHVPSVQTSRSAYFLLFIQSSFQGLPAILQSLAKSEILPGDERPILELRCSHVLKDGLRKDPKNRLKVCDLDGLLCTLMRFVGEGAIDLREFFRIMFCSAKDEYLSGTPNTAAVQVKFKIHSLTTARRIETSDSMWQ